ncbi:MAG TPA: G/U mismatch-specific DNA glycosylase [Pyrinomonadaceae bacterium]|nr:G/U mismatch-specific DNA glycosylase [Acidobacteriota bacterium]HQZ96433.1 G/U mismatch-specific DNA glycosylase [Pyrinomonadaceae bacterium]
MAARKPTKQELADAVHLTIEDIIGPDLKVLFCGINPGLYSGATGLHFARPGNRFWKVLYGAGFTDRLLDPSEEAELLDSGYGITCFVERTTARADELSKEEFIAGGKILLEKLDLFKPKMLGVLGLGAYRTAFDRPKARVGLQEEKVGNTGIWLLPNPSGLNANYQLTDFIELFSELKTTVE